MDTVSIIRGNVGRGPLDEKDRIYMMKKELEHKSIAPKAPVNAIIPSPKGSRSFEFVIEATEAGEKLIDSYTGVDFSILYKVVATCRTRAGKAIEAELVLIINCPGGGINIDTGRKMIPHDFVISHENLETSTSGKIPKFKFEGRIYSTNCAFNDPFDGFIIKRNSELSVKSLEIQLVRVESFQEKTSATEVQNIQVADGDCLEDIEIPTYMLFPKPFSCSTV